MKKLILIFLVFFLSFCSSNTSATIIQLASGNVATAVNAASSGDIIELTTSGGAYSWGTATDISSASQITIRAQAGLAVRPIIKPSTYLANQLIKMSTTGGLALTIQGVEYDANNTMPVFVWVAPTSGANYSINIDNCYIHGLNVGNLGAFHTSGGTAGTNSLTVTNSIFDMSGWSVFVGHQNDFSRIKDMSFSNVYFKGSSNSVGTINGSASYVGQSSYNFDHCTFDSNTQVDLMLYNSTGGTTTITNTIFANNSSTTSNILANGNLNVSNVGIYYTAGIVSTVYPTSGANTLLVNPAIGSNGVATESAYLRAGTDGKNIGFYITTPYVSASKTTLSGFTYLQGTGPSAEQSFNVNGSNLSQNLTVTASANYEISTGTGALFVATPVISLTPVNGSVTITPIYVRLKAGLSSASFSENIVIASTNASSVNVALSGSVYFTSIAASVPSLTGFNYTEAAGPSTIQSFNVNGSNLTTNLLITASANYEISTASGASFVATSPINLVPTAGTITSKPIYVRLKAGLSGGVYSENISLSTTGVNTLNVAVSGSVTHLPVTYQVAAPADLTTKFSTLADGDILELTTNGGAYTWSTNITVLKQKSLTIRAAANLTSRPIITATSNYTGGLFSYSAPGGTTIILKGIEIIGSNLLTTLATFTCDDVSNYNMQIDNCYIHGLSATANAITYGGSISVSNASTLTLSNSFFDFNGGSVYYNPYSNNFPQNIVVSNCYFKGIYSTGVIETTYASVKNATIDHCTFNGNTGYELGLRGSKIIASITNTIFANNTGSTNNVIGNATLNGTKCAVYYTGTGVAGTIYPTLTGSNALLTNPVIDAYGNATASEYINAGTDGKTIGCYFAPPITPNVTVSTDKLQNLSYDMYFGPSSEQTFSVSGMNLSANLVITPPIDYEISLTYGTGFSSNPITFIPSSNNVANATIYVRLKAGLPNNGYFENIIITSTDAPTHQVLCPGTVNFAPIMLNNLIYNFGQGPSVEKSFTVSGFNLTDNLSIVPPVNYEISLCSGNQFAPTNPIVLSPTSGTVNKTIVYTRLKANLAVNSYNEKVLLMSSQATEKSVTLEGKVDTISTAINNLFENEIVISSVAGGLIVQQVEDGKRIEVFNALGQKIISVKSKSGANFISICKGIYIIKVGVNTKKIIL